MKYFLISDTHGWFDEWVKFICEESKFDPLDDNNKLILIGDIIDRNMPLENLKIEVNKIKKFVSLHNNIIYLLGNHEMDIINKYPSVIEFEWLSKLPCVFENDDFIAIHGWLNPRWGIEKHLKRSIDKNILSKYGDILNGSPAKIYETMRKFYEKTTGSLTSEWINSKIYLLDESYQGFFNFKTFNQYEEEMISFLGNKKLYVGHYHDFLWDEIKLMGKSHEDLDELFKESSKSKNSKLHNILLNYSFNPFYSSTNKIICIDVFSKGKLYGFDLILYSEIVYSNSEFKLHYLPIKN